MYKLGEREDLRIKRIGKDLVLDKEGEKDHVLMDKRELEKKDKIGDKINVFIYNDSHQLRATKKEPYLKLGEIGHLEVVATTKIGAFMDIGLDKDVLLPFKEQTSRVYKNQKYLAYLYIDKSNRLALTMRIRNYLQTDSPYQKDDWVDGVVYNVVDDIGVFVAVDNKYEGMIAIDEVVGLVNIGDPVKCRVVGKKDDGRLNLSFNELSYKRIDSDSELILKEIYENDGYIPFNDKSDPNKIKARFKMSKSSFKRAVGSLLKENKVEFYGEGIRLKKGKKK
ncbi:MAG: S1-like domain-containing RNA-binding protein [Finegoldia sp.]|nr:S1-like domain-containing RNA-binding protein [Finegoldia sp.]